MHEQDFHILEGREITLPELGREIENITGRTIVDSLVKSNVWLHTYQTLNLILTHL